jgi:hypothetical protein
VDWSDGRLEVTSYPQRVVPDKPQAKLLARMEFVFDERHGSLGGVVIVRFVEQVNVWC